MNNGVSTGPFLLSGPEVDRYLAAEGALAQAAWPDTIRISSQILHHSARLRRAVFAHELAHLAQMARPGHDLERALEDEAWEAAQAWLHGQPFRIRGRASGRLNAAAILDYYAHPHAEPWYKMGQEEPIGNNSSIKVNSVHSLKGMSLESILDKIIELKGTTEFVIVCHGNRAGLDIPLISKSIAKTDTDAINALATDRESQSEGPAGTVRQPAISDEKVKEVAMINDIQHIVRLRLKINQVRARGLKHIAFRACNLGSDKDKDTLKTFNRLFQAASVSAPNQEDSYGTFDPGTPLAMPELKKWAQEKRLKGFSTSISDDVALSTKRPTNQRTLMYLIVCKPATKDGMAPWVKKHIFDGYQKGDIVYHAIYNELRDPQVHFVRDQEFKDAMVYLLR